jgi:hypothetical protein
VQVEGARHAQRTAHDDRARESDASLHRQVTLDEQRPLPARGTGEREAVARDDERERVDRVVGRVGPGRAVEPEVRARRERRPVVDADAYVATNPAPGCCTIAPRTSAAGASCASDAVVTAIAAVSRAGAQPLHPGGTASAASTIAPSSTRTLPPAVIAASALGTGRSSRTTADTVRSANAPAPGADARLRALPSTRRRVSSSRIARSVAGTSPPYVVESAAPSGRRL